MPAADQNGRGDEPSTDGVDVGLRGSGAGCRLLVVDDEPGIRLVLGRGLARYDYKVFLADSATEALRLLRDDLVVDAVVTDIAMPVMSGVELAEEVLRRHPGVPVLFVTGSPAPAELLANPLVDLVEKPVRIAMPRMSGVELAVEILRRHPGVPVLFVTGSPAPAELLTNPLVGLVEKPVRIAHVHDRLGELIARAAAARVDEIGLPDGTGRANGYPADHRATSTGSGSRMADPLAMPAGSRRDD